MTKPSGNIKNSTWNLANILLYPIAFLAKIAPWRCIESDIVNVYEEKFKNNLEFENRIDLSELQESVFQIKKQLQKVLYENPNTIKACVIKEAFDYHNITDFFDDFSAMAMLTSADNTADFMNYFSADYLTTNRKLFCCNCSNFIRSYFT